MLSQALLLWSNLCTTTVHASLLLVELRSLFRLPAAQVTKGKFYQLAAESLEVDPPGCSIKLVRVLVALVLALLVVLVEVLPH